ncbi:MAG: FcoT family thioesterase [Nanoarchaeota archaeon]
MITRISQDIIDSAQKEYKSEFIWLREANLDLSDRENLTCYGRFSVPAATYTKNPQKYIGCPEAIVCVNQLAYVTWAGLINEKLVDCGLSLEEFLDLPPVNMNMISINRLKFKRALRKDEDFWGKMTLISYRTGDLIIGDVKFDFGNRAFLGEGMFVISKYRGNNGNDENGGKSQ